MIRSIPTLGLKHGIKELKQYIDDLAERGQT